jgi:predicted ester cyclase
VVVDEELRRRRLEVLEAHFQSEVDHDWAACLADGDDAVLAYHRAQRAAFPDQRHDNVRFHVADDDTVVVEFDLLGTNTGEFLGSAPTGRSFRVPTIAVFFFDGDRITNERVYLDVLSLLAQIGRTEVVVPASGATGAT